MSIFIQHSKGGNIYFPSCLFRNCVIFNLTLALKGETRRRGLERKGQFSVASGDSRRLEQRGSKQEREGGREMNRLLIATGLGRKFYNALLVPGGDLGGDLILHRS